MFLHYTASEGEVNEAGAREEIEGDALYIFIFAQEVKGRSTEN
jgi:hypothetical protein